MILERAVVALGLTVASLLTSATAADSSTKPLVVSGVTEWGALAAQLVGADAKVVSLLTDPNADPHLHEATISDAGYVARASIVLENGAGYDTWLTQLVRASNSKVTVVNVGRLMGVSAGRNPHFFYNPYAAIKFVRALTAVLAHRPGFADLAARSRALLTRLDATQAALAAIARTCARVKVAATEDVTSYLLADAKLRVVTPEALRLAVGNGVDPSVQDLATALAQLRAHPAFLIDNIQTATPLTGQLVSEARAAHVAIIKVTETMRGTDYVGFLDRTVSSMSADLRRQGCFP